MNKRAILFFLTIVFVLFIYRPWVSFLPLTSGDWGYVYAEALSKFSFYPQAWNSHTNDGLGGSSIFLLGLNTYYFGISAFLYSAFRASWIVIERFLWVFPHLVLIVIGPFIFYRNIFSFSSASLISVLVYGVNTYILMISSGGQMGVILGYAVAPLVLYGFFRILEDDMNQKRLFRAVVAGLFLSLQFAFDVRLTYITLIAAAVWTIVRIVSTKNGVLALFAFIPLVVAGGVHAFWLLPFVIVQQNPLSGLGEEFTSIGMVKFLSFAPFEHTLSFLQPNWPENIFGKIHFLPSEFLLIPLVAFSGLLFVWSKNVSRVQRKIILYFSFLGLIGAFFSKGANPPFGHVYLWLFDHVPGFVMFRDSTKFYLLTALSYSILIPFSLFQIGEQMKRNNLFKGNRAHVLLTIIFLFFWASLHREAVMGTLGGTFAPKAVPQEYIRLKEYLFSQTDFSRVLWVPRRERHGYVSDNLPGLSLDTIGIASPSSFLPWIADSNSDVQLARYSVGYIVVPTDPQGELFVTDGTYDDALRISVIAAIEETGRFEHVPNIQGIDVYKTKIRYGHIFMGDRPSDSITHWRVNPTRYEVDIPKNTESTELIFSESYDPYWIMAIGGRYSTPVKTYDGLQRYQVQTGVSGKGELRYMSQDYVEIGLWISGISALLVIGWIGYVLKKIHNA